MTDLRHPRHLRLAVAGQEAAMRGDHQEALGHYREAMHIAVRAQAPEVFFRHYLESTLESLELMGAFAEVLSYCDRAIDHYAENIPSHELAWLDLATIHQRRGVVLLKQGDTDGAQDAFLEATTLARRADTKLELAGLLLSWLRRGLVITKERVLAEQRRLQYFSVRPSGGVYHLPVTSSQ